MRQKNSRSITTAQKKGKLAEDQACRFLLQRGMRLLSRNYRTRLGELDLIMEENDTIVFVEVRYRKNDQFGGAVGSINQGKQQRIIAAAQHYLQAKRWQHRNCRFDVIAISGQGDMQWLSNVIESS